MSGGRRDDRRESQSLLNGGGGSDASVEREWERAPRTCARCFQLSLGIVVLLAAAIAAAAASPWDRPAAPPPPPVSVQTAPSQTLRRELELLQQNTQMRQELRDVKAELAQLRAARAEVGKGGGRRRGKRQAAERLAGAERRARKGRSKALPRLRRGQPAGPGTPGFGFGLGLGFGLGFGLGLANPNPSPNQEGLTPRLPALG